MKAKNKTRTAGMVVAAALSLAAAVAGCAGGKASVPTAEQLSAAGALPRGSDVDAVRRGRVVFVTECGACHRLYLPAEYAPQKWRTIATRMGIRASLGEEQIADLVEYLTAASSAGR